MDEMSSPAANTRARKRARENEPQSDVTPVDQSAEAPTAPNKRRKLSAGKSAPANTQRKKATRGSSAEGRKAGTALNSGKVLLVSGAHGTHPAPAETVKSSGAPQAASNTKQSPDTYKTSRKQQGAPEGNGAGGELPLAYPAMLQPEFRNDHVMPEHIEQRLMIPNLKDPKVRSLMEDWKPEADQGMARIRREYWRATRKATKARSMSNKQWESDYWDDADTARSKLHLKVVDERGVPEGEKELLGEKKWLDEDRAWLDIANLLTD